MVEWERNLDQLENLINGHNGLWRQLPFPLFGRTSLPVLIYLPFDPLKTRVRPDSILEDFRLVIEQTRVFSGNY